MFGLAAMLALGKGVTKDLPEAARLMRAAVDAGITDATKAMTLLEEQARREGVTL
jgi:TPR repeat protein